MIVLLMSAYISAIVVLAGLVAIALDWPMNAISIMIGVGVAIILALLPIYPE